MYKKMLTIILAISIVAALGVVNIGAASLSASCQGYDGPAGGYYGGYFADAFDGYGVYGNSYTGNQQCTNGVDIINWFYDCIWTDIGSGVGDMADAYSSDLDYVNIQAAVGDWACYHWSNPTRK